MGPLPLSLALSSVRPRLSYSLLPPGGNLLSSQTLLHGVSRGGTGRPVSLCHNYILLLPLASLDHYRVSKFPEDTNLWDLGMKNQNSQEL